MIRWVDSRQPVASWRYIDDIAKGAAVECATVGWLLDDGADAKVIAQTVGDLASDTAQANGVMVIPTLCILSVKALR